ncbi:phage replication initiation protein, NGO0469 family [Limnohabitans sp. Rim8]|uniref:phage replication initiation protein, NGO0469 family n=1 Tax=Limnohabitans sp. Rim8 TaxID=1100718 RepID=UPI0033060219
MDVSSKEYCHDEERPLVPPGIHLARCYGIINLGTQKTTHLGGIKHLNEVMLQFELHDVGEAGGQLFTANGKPMSISKSFTLSLAEKATLRKDIQTWHGRKFTPDELRGFQLKSVLGEWALISVTNGMDQNGQDFASIAAIRPVSPQVRQAAARPAGHNKLQFFVCEDPDIELFDSFSESLKEKIRKSPEWQMYISERHT